MSLPSIRSVSHLQRLLDAYVSRHGDYLEQGPVWSKRRWRGVVASESECPPRLTRRYILSKAQSLTNFVDAEEVFVESMVWGYGNVGYGPYRVRQMVGSADLRLGEWVLEVAEAAKMGDHCAYEHIMSHRLSYLGPSFSSKLAYFLTPSERSPILDSVVAAWVERYEGVDLFNADRWSVTQMCHYQEYVQALLDEVADLLPVEHRTRGLIEHLMFVDQSVVDLPSWVKSV